MPECVRLSLPVLVADCRQLFLIDPQLANVEDDVMLQARNIVYVPDFVANRMYVLLVSGLRLPSVFAALSFLVVCGALPLWREDKYMVFLARWLLPPSCLARTWTHWTFLGLTLPPLPVFFFFFCPFRPIRRGIVNCANEQYGRLENDPAIERHFGRDWENSCFNITKVRMRHRPSSVAD